MFPDAKNLKRNKAGSAIAAMNEYECGCAIVKDAAGGFFIYACEIHNAAPQMKAELSKLRAELVAAQATIRTLRAEIVSERHELSRR